MSDDAGQASGRVGPCAHPAAVGKRWGDPIGEERQRELRAQLDAWAAETDHGKRIGPFDPTGCDASTEQRLRLTGADVGWLAEHAERDFADRTPNLHLEGAHCYGVHLEGARLVLAHLERADFSADIFGREQAYLERADFRGVHLEGANLSGAHLEGADLRKAWFDNTTILSNCVFDARTCLGDIQWSGVGAVNLTQVNWTRVRRLGDEARLQRRAKVEEYEAAARAYRQLAAQLRAQGMSEVADRFLYRAQVMQRKALWRGGRAGRWLGTWLLDVSSGHGYKPMRSLITYVAVVAGFALAYYLLGANVHPALTVHDAVVFSITSFHGRGFAPGENISLHNPLTTLAAAEAVLGLLIEITFIATFTQRFFAR